MLHQVSSSSLHQTVGQLDALNSEDIKRLQSWNCTDLDPVQDTVHGSIELHMKANPEAPVVCFIDQKVSYRDLDKMFAALAAQLCKLRVRPEAMIRFCFDKSLWAIVAVLGTLRAGAACRLWR